MTPVRTVAFAGAGHVTGVHGLAARALGLTITHVASRRPGRAAERAEQMGATACRFADLPAGADVVMVCTPPSRHADHAIQALQGGAAAIVEKPLATTLADADRLVEAARQSGGRVAYAENLAFAPAVELALAHRPRMGALTHLDVRVQQSAPDWGDFLTEAYGGGVLFDVGVHAVALVLLLARPARPIRVSASLSAEWEHPVDDHAAVTFSFDSGLHAHLTASWRPTDAQVWDLQAASAQRVLRMELAPHLAVEVNGEPQPLPAPRPDLPEPRLDQLGYRQQLERFVADFGAAREPVVNAAFGREVLDAVMGAYASAGDGGRPCPLPFGGPRDRTPLELWQG